MVTKNTKKILNYLSRYFELKNINQISRELGISVGSSFKILKDLEKKKWVLSEKMGNAIYYKINFSNLELIKSLELILIEDKRNLRGFPGVYASDLDNFDCDLIVLFGSVLRKNKFNDVDVLFVGCNLKKVSVLCLEISRIRSRPVVPLILTRNSLAKEIKNKKGSILDIIRTGVVLKGEDVFVEVLKDARL